MTVYNCKILETVIEDGLLRRVKYRCVLQDDDLSVVTEGNWKFRKNYVVDANTHEAQAVQWLDADAIQDGKHLIKYRLQEQLDALKSAPSTKPPWAVDTFKVTI
jgi:hypothetical protein